MNKFKPFIFIYLILFWGCGNNNKVEDNHKKEQSDILQLRKEKIIQQNKIEDIKREINLLKNKRDSIKAKDTLNINKYL